MQRLKAALLIFFAPVFGILAILLLAGSTNPSVALYPAVTSLGPSIGVLIHGTKNLSYALGRGWYYGCGMSLLLGLLALFFTDMGLGFGPYFLLFQFGYIAMTSYVYVALIRYLDRNYTWK